MAAHPAPGGPDPALFANLLCDWCVEPQAGQQVLVSSTSLAAPLLLELQRALLERGAWPLLRIGLPGQEEGFWAAAREAHVDGFAPLGLTEVEGADCSIGIQAPDNTRALTGVPPDRLARAARARRPLREARMRRRWCATLWPTPALAQQASMSLGDFSSFVRRALFLDREDPVAAWRELGRFQAGLVERLSQADELRLEAAGTDLHLRVGGRTWINSDGRRNMPSGEVFTGPHERSATGRVSFTVPASPGGVEVSGVQLELRDGEVVEARAEHGEDYLRQILATDDGARRLGELGVGTNFGIDRPVGSILLDEKIGGTVHVALGRSYPETGGVNESAVHWDLICDLREGGRLTADGEVVQEDGSFH